MGGRTRIVIIGIVLVVLLGIYCLPLMESAFPHGNDLFFHFSRIMGSVELLKRGVVDFKIIPGFYYDFGYAVGLFYPTGLLWIPIALVYAGLGFITSYKVLIVCITLLTAMTMGFTSFRLLKRFDLASIATLFYVFSVYRNYTDLYERAALGEYIAFAFIPLVFYGIHHIIQDKSKNWIYLVLGMVGLILSHMLSTMMVGFFLLLYLLSNYRMIIKNPRILKALVIAVLLTLGLTAYYWLPMIEVMMSDQFYYKVPWTHLELNTLTSVLKIVYFGKSISLFPYGIEFYALAVVLIGSLLKYKVIFRTPFLRYSWIAGFGSLAIAANLLPIEWFSFLDFIQFPWRFFMFVDYFFALLIAFLIGELNPKKLKIAVIILFVGFHLINYLDYSLNYVHNRMKDYLYTDFIRYSHEAREYLPSSIQEEYLFTYSENKSIISSNPIEITYERKADGLVFEFTQNGYNNTLLEIPLIYYHGYAAYITTDQQEGFLPLFKSEHSLISVNLENYNHGYVKVFYNGTHLMKLSGYISLSSFILALIFGFRLLNHHRHLRL